MFHAKGTSRGGETLTVTRIGTYLVRVAADHSRLPVMVVPLTQAMRKVPQAHGDSVFLPDRSVRRAKLDVSFNNEVS